MTSNDKRRDVAARLRKNEPSSFGSLFDIWREIALAVSPNGGSYKTLPLELSCLIEPEPERTCRDVSKIEYEFECSECGCEMLTENNVGYNMLTKDGKVLEKPSYCPNCGSRVSVQGEEILENLTFCPSFV